MKTIFCRLLGVAFFCITCSSLNAQSCEDYALTFKRLEECIRDSSFSHPNRALDKCDSLFSLARKIDCPKKIITALLFKARIGLIKDTLPLVKYSLDTAMVTITNRGEQFKEEELRHFKGDFFDLKYHFYHKIGKPRQGIQLLNTQIIALTKLGSLMDSKDSRHLRNCYVNSANYFKDIGDYKKALRYYDKARSLINKPGAYLLFINDVHIAKKDFEAAQENFKYYFELHPASPKKNSSNSSLSTAYIKQATLFIEMGATYSDSALLRLQEAKNLIDKESRAMPIIYQLEAKAHLLKGEEQQAIAKNRIALSYYETSSPDRDIDIAKVWKGMGEIYFKIGDLRQALAYYQKALAALVPELEQTDFYQNPEVDDPNIYSELLAILTKKTEALYKLQKEEPQFRELTLATAERTVAFIDSIRLNYFSEEDKQLLVAEGYSVFEKIIALHYDREDYEQAFYWSEKSRAIVLYEALKIKKAEALADFADTLFVNAYEIKKAMIGIRRQLKKKLDKNTRKELEDQEYTLANELKALQREMEKDAAFKNIMKEMSIVSAKEIANNVLSPGQAMVEFYSGSEHIYVFLIDYKTSGVKAHQILRSAELDTVVNAFADLIYDHEKKDAGRYVADAHLLYSKLLEPLFPAKSLPKRLIIIPDGELAYLPFSALLTQEVKDPHNFNTHPYLIRELALSQCFSASSLVAFQEKPLPEAWKLELLAYAPSFTMPDFSSTGKRGTLFPLLFANDDVDAVSENLEGKAMVMKGDLANKEHFGEYGPQSKIIHFSTHGLVDRLYPLRSYIAFSNVGIPDTAADSFKLGLDELYLMELNSEMVVLSACETGIGKLVKGEGTISIARGFIYAGARSVVTTLWSISEKSTYQIMKLFYPALCVGKAKDQALQSAVLQYLEKDWKSEGAHHPYHWAALTAIGNMEALDLEKSWWGKYYPFLILLLILLLFLFRRQKRQ